MRWLTPRRRGSRAPSPRLRGECLESRRLLAVGAMVPWVRYEAETGTLGQSAVVLGPNRTIGDPAGEASGRMAVKLAETGDFVEWRVTAPANALVMRVSIPDAAAGGGIDSTIGLYRNGQFLQSLPVTSKYAWVYGDDNAVTNRPNDGPPRRIYDESSTLLATPLASGDVLRVQKRASDTASSYAIDFVELESAAAVARPPGTISITEHGAVANDATDDTAAIRAAIAAAKARSMAVWIPPGQFRQSGSIAVGGVAVLGAGMWYSEVWGYNPSGDNAIGFQVTDGGTVFRDFRIRGEQAIRAASSWNTSGFFGVFGTGSELHDIWIERTQCGVWIGADNTTNPATNVVIDGLRIRNTFADGVNLCNGTVGTTVRECTARNTGDDAFASWSAPAAPRANAGNVFRNNTAECVWKAAGFAVYGGSNTVVEDNLVSDTLVYAGITIASSFSARAFQGVTTVRGNTLLRCGGVAWGQQHGAIWVYVDDSSITATVTIASNLIVDATYTAFEINASNRGQAVTGPLTFDGNTVMGADGLVTITYYAKGAATFRDTRIARVDTTALVANGSRGNFTATISGTTSVAPPVVAVPAAASAGPDPDRTARVSVLGESIAGETLIRYAWSASGPGPVVFAASGDNAAKATIATFTRAGSYLITATMTDPSGLVVTSSVTHLVAAVLAGIRVSSPAAVLLTETSEQFVAQGVDQFGAVLPAERRITWSADRGVISAEGLYAAPATSGQVTVTASAAGFTGSTTKPIDAFSSRQDIGTVGRAGSDTFTAASGTHSITGSGADIWHAADGFRFVSRPISDDATIVARVTTQTATNPWAKGGVMIREGTAANARFAAVLLTPANGVAFQWRTAAGANAQSIETIAMTAPRWVKLVRAGNDFTASQSDDGITWTPIGVRQTVPMARATLAGLAVTAHDNGLLSTATFTNVAVVTSASLAPAVVGIEVAAGSRTQQAAGFASLQASTPVVKTGAGTLVLDKANPLAASLAVRAGVVEIADAMALASATLVVESGATVAIAAGLATEVGGLVLAGRCDVGRGRITVTAGLTAAGVVTAIVSGQNGGTWDGAAGFMSLPATTAAGTRGVGWLENDDGSVTVGFSAAGDTNMDHVLDLIDAANVLASSRYDAGAATWAEGDFNYDGVFDILDVAALVGTGLYDAGDYVASVSASTAGSVSADVWAAGVVWAEASASPRKRFTSQPA